MTPEGTTVPPVNPVPQVSTVLMDLAAGRTVLQSPYLYMQAAGSDGSDGSTKGINLRWTLLRGLGDTHLPKGDLAAGPAARYPASYGFNKAGDFVGILGVPYLTRYPCIVNFARDRPVALAESGAERLWKFDTVVAATNKHCEVVIRFADLAQYDNIRQGLNPAASPRAFLAKYSGVVEAEVTNRLCFALTLGTGAAAAADPRKLDMAIDIEKIPVKTDAPPPVTPPPPVVAPPKADPAPIKGEAAVLPGKETVWRVEAAAVSENLPGAALFIACRRRFTFAAAAAEPRVCAENVKYFRFDFAGVPPAELRLETYEQFLAAMLPRKDAGWESPGDRFALSDLDAEVFARLEDRPRDTVNHSWPRYVGANRSSGLFTVNVPNYQAKWDPTRPPTREPNDANGLRQGVVHYLRLSGSAANPLATAPLPADDPADGGAFDISYLQMLKLVALDFHVARMLGLGCTAKPNAPRGDDKTLYVHVAVYRTLAALEPGGTAAPRTHLYMTLPTSVYDKRLPPPPVQEAPTFGIAADNGTPTPIPLTDANGYVPFDDVRIVNLHLAPYDTVQPFGPFFVPPAEFCACDVTKPVFYGCKYKAASEANWRVPELGSDADYRDASGAAEVAPLLQQLAAALGAPAPPIYSHQEREAGQHRYAFYGVNWFAFPSPLGNAMDVTTAFPARNTLLPPSNFAVQLIQPEDPLILTTAREQQKLAGLPPGDTTLVRATFEWNQNHYIPQKFSPTNIYADKVQIFFRQAPPRAVQGTIKSVTDLSPVLAEVRTKPYTIASVSPPQTVSPAVVPGDEPRFAGSAFASNDTLYVVDSVAQSSVAGEGAVFRVRKQSQTTVVDLDNNNQQSAVVHLTAPAAGDRFLAVENLNEPANWGAPLAKQVALINFLDNGQLHTETVSNPDGSQKTVNIGGIAQLATVSERLDVDSTSATAPPRGNPIPNSKTGIFDIVFASFQLPAHSDPDVEWYKGTVRIREAASGKMKVLEVRSIDTSGSTLKLRVYDPTFKVGASYVPAAGYHPIQAGSGVRVVFHPGYRCYFKAQAGVLTQATTLPGPADSAKQTLLAARASNSVSATLSNPTAPVVMQAHKISPPLRPDLPSGPLYATRPNVDGKATWTMDVKVTANATRQPYALVFYRANERAVLDTLYKGVTADAVEAALAALAPGDAAFDANRWNDLVNVANLHADLGFHQYVAGGYRFPIPDNTTYMIPGTTIAPFDGVRPPGDTATPFSIDGQAVAMPDVVRHAVEGAFLPLTEAPVIYQFIKPGTQTSGRKPSQRNANGDLLAFDDPAFDPSPMAVRYVGGGDMHVRFTDYTLDGAAKDSYFYFAAELSDELKFSPRSPIAGPIHLVNAYPAEAPAIRKVTSILEDRALQVPTSVKLAVNAYLAAEGIVGFNLYRANNPADAATTRSMKLVGAYDAVPGAQTELVDDFSDVAFPPFGDPLFYRVVALRGIVNERGAPELIPSKPSTLARASIVDVRNPVAPPMSFSADPPTPAQLTASALSWPAAAYNAAYHLYKQDRTGNWTRIYSTKTNNNPVTVTLAVTALGSGVLLKQDGNGRPIRHRFKLEVENTSGMFSLNESILEVPAACAEGRARFGTVLSYADTVQAAAPLADRLVAPSLTTHPGTMTFKDVTTALPAGHVFDRIEVTVGDGLGHAARKTIAAHGGSVSFQHGDGNGLVLNGAAPNVDYAVRAAVFTDSCQDGMRFAYTLRYGPQVALLGLAAVLSYADSQTPAFVLSGTYLASAAQFPTTMTFADVTQLPAGHSFIKIDIAVKDDAGGAFTRSITAAHGTATFHHGDGGLALDGSAPHRVYQVSARLFTNLCPNGIPFAYGISYA